MAPLVKGEYEGGRSWGGERRAASKATGFQTGCWVSSKLEEADGGGTSNVTLLSVVSFDVSKMFLSLSPFALLPPFPSCVPSLLPTSLRHRVMLKTAWKLLQHSFQTQKIPHTENTAGPEYRL